VPTPLGLVAIGLLLAIASTAFQPWPENSLVFPVVTASMTVVLLLILGRAPLQKLVRRVRVVLRRAVRGRHRVEQQSELHPTPDSSRRVSARLQLQLEREIQKQKTPSRAINVLVRRIALELHGGFVAVAEVGEGSEARVTNSRGLSDASRRLHLDSSLLDALNHGPVALSGRALRRTSLFESLAPGDRRRIRHGISLIPIGPVPVAQWLLTTALLPLDSCEEQQRERLVALCRMAWNRGIEASSTRRTEPRSGCLASPLNPFTSPSSQIRDVLDGIRTTAGIDRASLFLLTSTGTLTLGPTVTVGGRLPPGVELKWREQERRLGLALLTKGGFERYDEAELGRLKIGSLWNAAWGDRVVLRGQTIGVLCATAGRTPPEEAAIRELIQAASNEITRVFERMLPHSAARSATEPAQTRQVSEPVVVNRPALRESPNGHTTAAWSQDFAIPKNVAAAFLSGNSPSLHPTPAATPAERKVAEPSRPVKTASRASANPAPAASDDGRLQFLANMTHELRAPMTGILGMTEIVLDTNLTDEQRRCLASVRSSSQSLLQLVNDLLDFSKLEARGVEIERTEFSLRSLLREALLPMAVQARQKGLAFHCETPQDLCDQWRGDPLRLRQVVTNLVGNALKFTDAGQISVRIEPFAETHLRISVTDTGLGIPVDRRQRIFQAYAQADASTARKHGGTGLGLAISRQLVELMDGQIWLESEEGRGSTFSFTVRLERVAEGSAPVEVRSDPPATTRLRILVVDDHEINRSVARLKLEARGHTIEVAASGREACDAFAQWPFDLILMDVQMSDLDGLTAARAIRRRERPIGRRTPIFALTSTADAESRARCFEAGMDEVLLKPIDPLAVETRLQGLIKDRETLAPAAPAVEFHRAPSRPEPNDTAAGNRSVRPRTPPHLAKLRESFLPMFLESAEDVVDELRGGLDADDFERIQRAAHSLNGSAGTLGYDELSHQAGLVEAFARRQQRASIEPLIDQIFAGLEECRQELPLSNGAASHRPLTSTVPCP
jgi:signal transduction histidine kinase/CheY-like chemotaxis protein/HPt (histidine-containing phosphotransfer) domain-containing protein